MGERQPCGGEGDPRPARLTAPVSRLRFSDLLRRIEGISQKMLTQTLRALERDGLVLRTATLQVPVRGDYELTDAGRSLVGALGALEEWSIEHFAGVHDAQEEYSTRVG